MAVQSRLASSGIPSCSLHDLVYSEQINEEEELTLIDFPQMVSVGHGNARELFHRDVECIIR